MGGIGVVIAFFAFLNHDYKIPWKHYPIKDASKDFIGIAYIEFNSSLEDPTGDTIYVYTKDDLILSNTLFENEWLFLESVPVWNTEHISGCAPVWPGAPSDAQIWEPPPTEKKILDSAGVRFERPLSIIVRCYVLSDDGSLEVWVRGDDAGQTGVLAFAFYAQCFGIIGILVGINIGVYVVRKKK